MHGPMTCDRLADRVFFAPMCIPPSGGSSPRPLSPSSGDRGAGHPRPMPRQPTGERRVPGETLRLTGALSSSPPRRTPRCSIPPTTLHSGGDPFIHGIANQRRITQGYRQTPTDSPSPAAPPVWLLPSPPRGRGPPSPEVTT